MIIYNEFHDVEKPKVYHNKYGDYSDDIYCFDIETTNLFKIDGEWRQFDKTIKDYKNIDMASCVYHCQFSVNDKVYGFRHINELEDILKEISNPMLCKVVWVHNLNFEFQHMIPILKKYTITNMIARKSRMPICFHIEELNIDFRCSLRLTELSLERSSEQFTNVKKAKGDLDYNKSRHPLTPLTDKEKYYCEMDCVCLYEIIKYFRKQYKHVRSIPYTQTGRVRRAMKEIAPKSHFDFIKKHTPTVEEYKLLSKYVFMGGISHANPLHVRDYITKQHSYSKDIASSYPTQMTTKRFPMENFRKIKVDHDKMYPMSHYCKIYDIVLSKVKSKMYNHYISFSKCFEYENEYVDNGRLVSADKVHLIVTDVDFEMIKKCYRFDVETSEIKNIYVAKNDYLPKWIIQFILKNYGDKTTLKGIEGKEDIYLNSKQIINCIYGSCVTNIVKSSVAFDSERGWITPVMTDELIQEKLDDIKSSSSKPLFLFSWGCWVTAYAREALFLPLTKSHELDFEELYHDTDSHKLMNLEKHEWIFEDHNRKVLRETIAVCKHYNLPLDLFSPKDKFGNKHPLGFYEPDGEYTEFVTLGSKKYCYRDTKGELHITVSGVGKGGVAELQNNIHNFNQKTHFGYDTSFKLAHTYIDEQHEITFKDFNGVEYKYNWGSGLVLYPTTYQMSITPDFDDFLCSLLEYEHATPDYQKIVKEKGLVKRKKGDIK